ncbi:carbohydrate-binding protein [Actinoplanes flavus]|uniref:Ig-like domain repeat protein n=1 Tax=Actinoplanes flavus TaxID=2820290 RepID=A0ABS3UTA7_9ACTN|nr:carbohydrate-binding protein [Actinoplanes flavus]MBO3741787.1 Ig-like domain repeat protein [Actinoplanes flavus]
MAAVWAVLLAAGFTTVTAPPAYAQETSPVAATVRQVVIDETDHTSRTETVVELGLLTVRVNNLTLAELPSGTRIKITVPGASTPEEAAKILQKDPGAITAVEIVAMPGPSVGTHGPVVHDITVIPFTWEGATAFTRTPESIKADVQAGLNQWAAISRGMITPGTVTMLDTVVTAKPQPCNLGSYASVVKTTLGHGPSGNTDHWMYVPSQNLGCGWAGVAWAPGNEIATADEGYAGVHVTKHEFGHNLGLSHAAAEWCGPACDSSKWGAQNYLQPTGTWSIAEPLTSDYSTKLGWFTDTDTPLITGPGTYQLTSIDQDSGVRALRFRPATGTDIYVEYRPTTISAPTARPGWVGGLQADRMWGSQSLLLDVTPGWAKNDDAMQPTLTAGNTWRVPGTGYTVRLASADATTAGVVVTDATADTQAPAAPGDVTIPGSSNGRTDTPTFTVGWTPAASAEADTVVGYRVTVRSATGSQWVVSAPADKTSAEVTLPTAQNWWPTGAMTITVQALDAAGNASTGARLDSGYKADPNPPDMQAPAAPTDVTLPDSGGDWVGSSFTVGWTPAATAVDDKVLEYRVAATTDSGVQAVSGAAADNTSAPVYLPIGSGVEGPVTITVQAIDAAGNASTEATATAAYDTKAPAAVNVTQPVMEATVQTTALQITWDTPAETGSGLDHYQVGLNYQVVADNVAGGTNSVTLPLPPEGGGNYVNMRAVDKAGNYGAWGPKIWFNVARDITAPTNVRITQPADGSTVTGTTFQAAWDTPTETGSGLDHYRILIDGTVWITDVPAGTNTTTVTTPAGTGNHTLAVQAFDKSGNASSAAAAQITFTVASAPDTTAPTTVHITSPASGSTVTTATYELAWDIPTETGSGLDHYQVLIDSVEVNNNVPAGTNTLTLNTPTTDGQHYAEIRAYDKAGNRSSAASSRTYFNTATGADTTAPSTVQITSPANGSTVTGASIQVTWNAATDTGSGLDHYELVLDGTAVKTEPAPLTSTSLAMPSVGEHTLGIRAYDKAGNRSSATASQVTFTVGAAPGTPAPWTVGTRYEVGDLVTYNGTTYRCLQAHTAQIDWAPATTAALWQPVT